jgi:uncharacterized iron-regulated protein
MMPRPMAASTQRWQQNMKSSSVMLQLLLLLCLLLPVDAVPAESLLYADHPLAGKIWDMQERRMLDERTLLERIAAADVVLLGETHDNSQHHALQLKLLQVRLDAGVRPALLFEQFDRERQLALDEALAKTPPDVALEAAAALLKGWDWKFYKPLVAAGLEYKLPVYAANFSRERARPVIREGFAAFDAAELKRLAVEAVWSERQQQYLTHLIEGTHCGQVNVVLRDGLVRSQRLRDAVMADAAAAAASMARGVVGIVGRGHARRDIGMPLYLAARYPQARVYSIGLVEVSPGMESPEAYEQERATDGPVYDAIWFTARVDRPDPCASFGGK